MLPPAKNYYTPQEYLRLEEQAKFKSEYIDGEIFSMAGGSPDHNQIAVNLTIDLGLAFQGTSCQVLNSDTKVAVDIRYILKTGRTPPGLPAPVTGTFFLTELEDKSR